MQFCTIHEISLYDAFADVGVYVVFVYAELLVLDVDLHALQEAD